jgi:hypothetical protein
LPGRFPYELRELAREHEHWKDPDKLRGAIRADALRVLSRKETHLNDTDRAWVEQEVAIVGDEKMLLDLSRELLVARQIGAAQQQAAGLTARRRAISKEVAT